MLHHRRETRLNNFTIGQTTSKQQMIKDAICAVSQLLVWRYGSEYSANKKKKKKKKKRNYVSKAVFKERQFQKVLVAELAH